MRRTELVYFISLYGDGQYGRTLIAARFGDALAVSALTGGENATCRLFTSFNFSERAFHPDGQPKLGDMLLVTCEVTESGFTTIPPHFYEELQVVKAVLLPSEVASAIKVAQSQQDYPSAEQP